MMVKKILLTVSVSIQTTSTKILSSLSLSFLLLLLFLLSYRPIFVEAWMTTRTRTFHQYRLQHHYLPAIDSTVSSASSSITTITTTSSLSSSLLSSRLLLNYKTNNDYSRYSTSRIQRPIGSIMMMMMIGRGSTTDLQITFGSDANKNQSGGVSWGEADEDDDDNNNSTTTKIDKQRFDEILNQVDIESKLLRRKQLWGQYANVTSKVELNEIYQQEQEQIKTEFHYQKQLAQKSGVYFELLEPKDNDDDNEFIDPSNTAFTASTNVQITIGKSNPVTSGSILPTWLNEMDDELRSEWEQLTANDNNPQVTSGDDDDDSTDKKKGKGKTKKTATTKSKKSAAAADSTDEDDNNDNNDTTTNMVDVRTTKTGVLKARQAFSGVRVGSAGGWTLEVFPGDYVVHRKYGIGRFERTCLQSKTRLSVMERTAQEQRRADILTTELRKLQKNITTEDIQMIRSKFGTVEDTDPISNPQITVLEISYKDAVVHVPVDRAYRLSRYRAGDAVVKPKLSRVKGEAWSKTRRTVEESTMALAQDVLALYATRETLQRPPFNPSMEQFVQEFAKTFPYEPTPDQKKCFEDIENDMIWRSRPMDRLICGDVGFGKTEVAIRALYRSCVNGRQCALLAPTGVLAAQHYKNIMNRMGPSTPFNISITLLRGGMGKNTKVGKEVRSNIKDGTIQLIVGTHALLSNDLQFNNLGLLVVDEEQRFGVKQKERLKLISNGVDVLTLSATPIPRTLQMSLSGIRDTSTIRSPPPMRKPVMTYVQDFNEEIVYHAISTELQRGGQCYYVVPRISMIHEAENTIQKLFPNIRIIQAHGRMLRNGAEENVANFAEGKADVLLATTVIENGVDIPTVNTIIVQNSQAFGMSTLYQLRGRVGRSDQQAFAFFLHREESVTEQAALRLQAIGELNELGSGFDVANRDLEIRGAGSLLGTEQSGVASKVGFDLYMRLLKKSIRKLRGLDVPTVPRTNIISVLDPSEVGTVSVKKYQSNAFTIPAKYISDDTIRYGEESKARLAESTSKLVELTNEWKTQYGAIPAVVQNQLKTMHLHACTRRLGIDLIGLIDSGVDIRDSDSVDIIDNDENPSPTTRKDLIMRSPGLRPRHWAAIVSSLPKMAMPRGFDVIFPSRFTLSGEDLEIEGGRLVDMKVLAGNDAYDYGDNMNDDTDEDWDSLDQEEIEAMKDIASANNIKSMDEIDIEQYPRFVMKGGGGNIDKVLKMLLPLAKIVYEKQEQQAANAQSAAALRERQEMMRQRKKIAETSDTIRLGYRY